jgi:hypothetical protein
MFIEHLLYSAAFALIVGMVYYRWTGRDPSWIIILCAFVPDISQIAYQGSGVSITGGCPFGVHSLLHSAGVLLVFSLALGALLVPFGIRFWEGSLFAGIGFAAHLFEDALVFNPAYPFFWPFSSEIYGIGLIEYTRDFYGIADIRVLIVGLVLFLLAVAIRTHYEGKQWIYHYLPFQPPESSLQ